MHRVGIAVERGRGQRARGAIAATLAGAGLCWLPVPASGQAAPASSPAEAPVAARAQASRIPNARLAEEIRQVARQHGLSAALVESVIRAESAFNPRAQSPKGAQGLMQLMPGTAASLGVRDAFDPRQNIDGGVRHLRALIDRYLGNVPLAVAAYNAGAGAVDVHRGIPPYPETQQYVQKVLRDPLLIATHAVPVAHAPGTAVPAATAADVKGADPAPVGRALGRLEARLAGGARGPALPMIDQARRSPRAAFGGDRKLTAWKESEHEPIGRVMDRLKRQGRPGEPSH